MRQSLPFGCHCKRCVAIHAGMKSWIATAFGLAMTETLRAMTGRGHGLDDGNVARDDHPRVTARSAATRQSMTSACTGCPLHGKCRYDYQFCRP